MTALSPVTPSRTAPVTGRSDQQTAFQDAVAGLFYGQMIKSLRSGVGKPAYLHGGQGEDLFQAQMDQLVAEQLARRHGGAVVRDLYQRFLADHPESNGHESNRAAPSQLASLAQSVKSAPTLESAQDASWARPTASVPRNTTGTGVISALIRK